jgi:molybdate transport system substrate-binding protein
MVILPDAQILRRDPAFRGYSRSLRQDQSRSPYRPAPQVDKMPVPGKSIMGRIFTHRTNNDPVLQNDIPYLKRSEQISHNESINNCILKIQGHKFTYNSILIYMRNFLYLLIFSLAGPLLSSFNIPPPSPTQKEVLVAAAADLKFAMDSLITIFKRSAPDITVKVVYGSSGNFFEQIANGAPFDLFFSADMDYPRKLQEQKKTIGLTNTYGTGQIVLWSRKLDPASAKMNTLLRPEITKIAIANPAHAPYGKRARESLMYYKLYDPIKDKLVLGENISQTAEYVRSGAAEIGIIALSLALSPTMQKEGGKYWVIPAETHQPLQQGYTLLQHAKDNAGAEKFAAFINSAAATAILKYFGFSA